jgi:hypothetical protein
MNKSNIDYRFGNAEDIYENFTYRNLDTMNDMNKINSKTKSNIFAPFNSILEIQSINKSNLSSFIDLSLHIENNLIKYANVAIDANREYELNFNGECDNGIIINELNELWNQSKSSYHSREKNKKTKKKTPINDNSNKFLITNDNQNINFSNNNIIPSSKGSVISKNRENNNQFNDTILIGLNIFVIFR